MRIIIPILMILILALLTFLLYGGDRVPEKIRSQKGYSYLTGVVKDKLPDQIILPFGLSEKLPSHFSFDLPFELPFDLPFELPFFGNHSGDGEKSDGKKTAETSAEGQGNGDSAKTDTGGNKENITEDQQTKEAVKQEDQNSGDNLAEAEKEPEEPAKVFTAEEEKIINTGIDEAAVLNDKGLYTTAVSPDWTYGSIKIEEHHTDVRTGTDTVVVYLEMENKYVKMTGTKEITYRFNEQTDQWEAGPVSKITCLTIEPVGTQQ